MWSVIGNQNNDINIERDIVSKQMSLIWELNGFNNQNKTTLQEHKIGQKGSFQQNNRTVMGRNQIFNMNFRPVVGTIKDMPSWFVCGNENGAIKATVSIIPLLMQILKTELFGFPITDHTTEYVTDSVENFD